MQYASTTSALDTPVPPSAETAPGPTAEPLVDGITPRPDGLSGHLPGWLRSRSVTAANGTTSASFRIALPALFAQATQTAAYKNENDDATFVERLGDGLIIAGLFDGVTVPKRHNRAGHVIAGFVRERLRSALVETDGRRPIVESILAKALEDAVGVLERVGGGAATTATVVVASPIRHGDWRLYTINAGNSRATLLLPDGTLDPMTRVKPPGTSFAIANTLTAGYRYKLETSKVTAPAGSTVLFTSDGVHDHLRDSEMWIDLGRSVEASLLDARQMGARGLAERVLRTFAETLVTHATVTQTRSARPDDTTAMTLLLGDPAKALEQKLPLAPAPARPA
jgi:serine/threonine protein phosphatase PrpC